MTDESTTQRIQHELAQADLFIGWDALLLELIASISELRTYQYGGLVFDENNDSDELYIIVSGHVAIQVNPTMIESHDPDMTMGRYETIAVLRMGQNFGEIALLDEGRRSAAAVCQDKTELIVIPRDKLILMCEHVPKLGYQLMRSLAIDLALKIRHADYNLRQKLYYIPQRRPHS